jgi:cobalt/nickel transport system ATP-binding protein
VTRALPVRLRGVSVHRAMPHAEPACVLEAVDLDLPAGDHLALIGPNGAGKTSLLLAMVGALPFTGEIIYGDHALGPATQRDVRAQLGFVFAEPADQLFTDRVYDEVAFGPRQEGATEADVRHRVGRALEVVGLAGFEARRPDALSLGEQRRLALATALARDAAVVFCDEPTSGLDPLARRTVVRALAELERTVVLATHDLAAAREITGRAALLRGGRVVAQGNTVELLDDRALLERAGLA